MTQKKKQKMPPNSILSVAAKDVKAGDEIFNSQADHPAFQWNRVRAVEEYEGSIILRTSAYDTWKHPKEGVAVRRIKLYRTKGI